MTHVLIAVDDTDTSVSAATTAHRLFGDDARYTVINVGDNPSLLWGDDTIPVRTPYPLYPGVGAVGGLPLAVQSPDAPEDLARDRIEEAQRRADDVAREAGLREARAVGDTGDAAEAILDTAKEFGVDVIVVGSHDRSWFSRLFGGSVSRTVARESDIPVLIAR